MSKNEKNKPGTMIASYLVSEVNKYVKLRKRDVDPVHNSDIAKHTCMCLWNYETKETHISMYALFMDGNTPIGYALLSYEEEYEINYNYKNLLSMAISSKCTGVILSSNKWYGTKVDDEILEVVNDAKDKLSLIGVSLYDYIIIGHHLNYTSLCDDMEVINCGEKDLLYY